MPLPGPYKHKSGNKKRKGKKEEAEKIAKLPKLDSFLVKSQQQPDPPPSTCSDTTDATLCR